MRYFFFLSLFLLGCAPGKYTRVFAPGKRLSHVKSKQLTEVSGLVASRANPGYLWVHNDGGNPAEIYLVDLALNVRLTCTFPDAKNRDWEDITIGPGPDPHKAYVYLGDIGDNEGRRPFKTIYRFEEPKADSLEVLVIQHKTQSVETEQIVFRLEDGSKDSEALLVDPVTKDILLISKREDPAYVYRLTAPNRTTDTLVAKKVTQLPMKNIVAADVSPDGKELLVKTYRKVYYWKSDSLTSLAALMEKMPVPVRYRRELQGEALGWELEGKGFYTLGEKPLFIRAPLYYYRKRTREIRTQDKLAISPH
jgi:hypothetical protein